MSISFILWSVSCFRSHLLLRKLRSGQFLLMLCFGQGLFYHIIPCFGHRVIPPICFGVKHDKGSSNKVGRMPRWLPLGTRSGVSSKQKHIWPSTCTDLGAMLILGCEVLIYLDLGATPQKLVNGTQFPCCLPGKIILNRSITNRSCSFWWAYWSHFSVLMYC